jgi:hypothetical protein
MIKVVNRRIGGNMFHYAHFLCDCLFPEVIHKVNEHRTIVREKNIVQTIGNFHTLYTQVMGVDHIELPSKQFIELNVETISYRNKEVYNTKKYFDQFRSFIFTRYPPPSTSYPSVLLIKRSERVNLIDDPDLKRQQDANSFKTGKERREMDQIDRIEQELSNIYPYSKGVYLEHMPFEEQVWHFYHATLIICAHGAAMSNLFFCQPGTVVLEVTCGMTWEFFDDLSRGLSLNHIKCHTNRYEDIMKMILSSSKKLNYRAK